MTLALNMVVFDEQHRIVDTLTAAARYCDEIVLVDQGSGDGTVETARPYTTTIVVDRHYGHPEPSRPLAEQFTRSSHILLLDADEQLDPTLVGWLTGLPNTGTAGAYLHRTNLLDGEEWAPEIRPHFRWWRKGMAYHPDRIHTQSRPVDPACTVISRPGAIIHSKTSAEQTIDDNNYRRLAAAGNRPRLIGTRPR